MSTLTLAQFAAMVGQPIATSKWVLVDQAMIDAFADVTADHQFIHVDPEAAAQTPFGGTIAHGFLTLSLLSSMVYDCVPVIDGTTMAVNYGFDKIRFINPVRSGARIRAHFTLDDIREVRPGEVQSTMGVSVEIEGEEKPALIAQWIGRRYFGEST